MKALFDILMVVRKFTPPRYLVVSLLLGGLAGLWPLAEGLAAPAKPLKPAGVTGEWRWIPSLVPKALLIEGLWTEHFKVEPAFHLAGIPFDGAFVSRSPYFGGYTRMYHLPKEETFNRYAVVVISNLDAPSINPERIKVLREFVAQGGGLVVLGGYWAYSRGGYEGTPLAEMLPATFPPENRIPPQRAGVPLEVAPGATWKFPALGDAKPNAFYVQRLEPKAGATVQMTAGGKPAFISGDFGKGRVVACALTPHGDPPQGVLPFWEWPDFTKVMAAALDWASAARPLQTGSAVTQAGPVLSEEEQNSLAIGGGITPEMARRICERPERQTMDALFAHAIKPEASSKVDLPSVYKALIPFAKPEWGQRLKESLEAFNPDLNARRAALVLLGASKSPEAYKMLLGAVEKEDTKEAAIEALGLLGRGEAVPLLTELLLRSESQTKSQSSEDDPAPGVFARQHSSLVAELSVALYRLGDPSGVQKLMETYRRVRLYQRIFENASKRRVYWTDQQGLGILKSLQEASEKLSTVREKLSACAGPVPESQRTSFLKAALEATDPADVEWVVLALEQSSKSAPTAAWSPLAKAKDGIIARLAAVIP